jgi:VanZ family protein
MKALRYWWPTIAWAAFIFLFSSGTFNHEHTSRFIIPFLKWLRPDASPELLLQWHILIRKAAHFVEYFLLSLLVLRSLRGEARGWNWKWALTAVLLCAGYAATDELHQAFVASRGAAMEDVLLDSTGALVAQLCAALRRRGANGETADEREWGEKDAKA